MSSFGRLLAHRRPRSPGQALVELALILPVLLALFLLALDVGRLFYTYVGVENAARDGAAYGAVHPTCWSSAQCADPGNITYAARQELGGDTVLGVSVVCSSSCASSTTVAGNTIAVTASRVFTFLLPVTPTMTLTVSATAVIQ